MSEFSPNSQASPERHTPERRAVREHIRMTLTRLSRTGELPALPAAATAALALARSTEAGVDELCRVIRGDVGLSARILRVANSAAYARRISCLSPARVLSHVRPFTSLNVMATTG